MIEKLTKQFIARYSKEFAELNKNVYPAVKDDGAFEVPVIELGSGGGTAVEGKQDAFTLNPPAVVQVKFKRMQEYQAIYRIAIPRSEAEIAADKSEYFNYLFDRVLAKAVGNFKATWGEANVVRFGESFCTYERPGGIFIEGDDFIEFRLFGNWASEKEEASV